MKKILKFIKRKSVLLWIVIGVIVILEGAYVLTYGGGFEALSSRLQPKSPPIPGIILFEMPDCDHCKKVNTFITQNKIEDKVPFTRLEISSDNSNANVLADKAQICGLDTSEVGVPFLWDGSKCILGDVDVIAFFKQKIATR